MFGRTWVCSNLGWGNVIFCSVISQICPNWRTEDKRLKYSPVIIWEFPGKTWRLLKTGHSSSIQNDLNWKHDYLLIYTQRRITDFILLFFYWKWMPGDKMNSYPEDVDLFLSCTQTHTTMSIDVHWHPPLVDVAHAISCNHQQWEPGTKQRNILDKFRISYIH